MSEIIAYNQPCTKPGCSSSDALQVYRDDHGRLNGTCYSCGAFYKHNELLEAYGEPGDNPLARRTDSGAESDPQYATPDLPEKDKKAEFKNYYSFGEIETFSPAALPERNISKETMELFGCKVAYSQTTREIEDHFYPRHCIESGKVVGYNRRQVEGKKFNYIGRSSATELFGQSSEFGGRNLLILTEGEIDAMAAHEILKFKGKDYKVCGAQSSNMKIIKNNLAYIESFKNVVLMLDQDDAGVNGAKKIAELLSPGKCRIAKWDDKSGTYDISAMLLAGDYDGFMNRLNKAPQFHPDGIICLSQTWDRMWENRNKVSVPFPYECLNKKLYGMREKEIVTLLSGSGMGKTTLSREISWALFHQTQDNIGLMHLEESVERLDWGLISLDMNRPLHIVEDCADVSPEDVRKSYDRIQGSGRLKCYDHFGSTQAGNLLSKIRYLIRGLDCRWIVLDHLSIVVSGMDISEDERRTIDILMTQLRQITEETGAGLLLVSHLRRPQGDKGHERGGEVSAHQARGSHSIIQLSDTVIGLEGDRMHEDLRMQNVMKAKALKNRYAGKMGFCGYLWYDEGTGRMHEIDDIEGFLVGEVQPKELPF